MNITFTFVLISILLEQVQNEQLWKSKKIYIKKLRILIAWKIETNINWIPWNKKLNLKNRWLLISKQLMLLVHFQTQQFYIPFLSGAWSGSWYNC